MNGVYGLNARTLNVSRDQIMAAALALGGKYMLAQDDPELVARAASAGLQVIYRQSQDETLSLDPAAFVAERAKNASAAAYLHLTNELDPTPELLAWTMEAMKYAETIKRKVCIFNFTTHRSAAQWQASADVIAYGVSRGHAVGLHVYARSHNDPSAQAYLAQKHQYGGTWLCTEFGYALDAHHGWRGTLSEQQYADFCRAWLPLFAAENMPALLFSYDHWTANEEGKAHGFGVNDAPTFLSAAANLNQQYPLKEGTPVPPVTPSGDPVPMRVTAPAGLNLRASYPSGAILRVMPLHEPVTGYPATKQRANGLDWITVRDAQANVGWATTTWLESAAPPAPAFRLKNPVGCESVISSHFGVQRDYDGDGIDEAIHEGTDITRRHADCTPLILAPADGVVMDVSSIGAYGNHAVISSVVGTQEYRVWLCHMAQMFVAKGQVVKAGDVVGVMGSTGNSTAPHLHLSIQKMGAPTPAGSPLASVIDPEPLIE